MSISTQEFRDLGWDQRAAAIFDQRVKGSYGRINKILGKTGPFTDKFKKLIRENHEGILLNPFLVRDLAGHKRVLTALGKATSQPDCADLLRRLQSPTASRRGGNILHPIWRHDRHLELLIAATQRYFFPQVFGELFFLTIIYDYAPNLEVVEDQLGKFRLALATAERKFTKRRRGLVLFGSFEPDLRSYDEIVQRRDLVRAAHDLGWQVEPHGGWVTSGHFIGRAPHLDEFKHVLEEAFPDSGGARVEIKPLRKTKTMQQNLLDAMAYISKYPEAIFKDGTTRGAKGARHSAVLRTMQNAFHGPTLPTRGFDSSFDQHAAIRQWALFMDRMGSKKLRYSIENLHAQKWLSPSETQFYISSGQYDWLHGYHRIEIHRDVGPDQEGVDPAIKHLVPRRRSRRLQIDDDWYELTDFSKIDPVMGIVPVIY